MYVGSIFCKGLLKKQYAANLKSKGVFEEVAQRLPSPLATVRPSEGIIMGMKNNLCEIWGHLEKEDVGIIGLYGLGGVGKTTLLTEVNNKFVNTTHDFDVVIWVTVSSNLDLDQVQDDIGKKMGLYDEIWKNKRPEGNKEDICGVLSKKKFVLLLDDMWERLDLLEVGIPLQNKQNSKIVFTTRSKRVCGQMDAHKTIEVECLPWGEAWDLFQKKVDWEIDWSVEGKEIETSNNPIDFHIRNRPCFHSLRRVFIDNCKRLKNAKWILFAPNIESLSISSCENMEEVISAGAWMEATEKGKIPKPFAKLNHLMLGRLPKLKSIYHNPLPFPCLVVLDVRECPELKKLPLNSDSAKEHRTAM
ncbi:unnamed protein product [Ilex paraguariensis]|uniref:NB-ARC domain-containing protein n=1 Tax=Ilex paraguariensis TaxID=185542 RepID=A0ABC8S8I3_9AQUA